MTLAFEGLRENIKERWVETLAKIQESSAYNTARETFESQTPTVQKAIVGGGLLIATVFLFSFPYGYLAQSGDNMAIFEENRSLIQGLLRASRTAKEAPPLPLPIDSGSLKGMLQRILDEKKLTPEQIGDVQAIPGVASKLAPALVVQTGIAAQIKQLNLTQIIDIANSIQNLSSGIKLVGMDIVQTAGQTHYYDLIVRVANFGLPAIAVDSNDERPNGRKLPNRRPAPGGGDDE